MGYFMLLVLMMFHFACLSSHSCHPYESSALLHFKTQLITNTTFYENTYYEHLCPNLYPKMRTWDNGTDCCSWMGVTCHSVSSHVIGLDLSCSALVGNIHSNSTFFHLTHLQTLSLACNYIYGSELPSQFGGFVSLTHLNLSYCAFKGDIPSQISHLSKLQSLDLSWNFALSLKETTWKKLLQNTTSLREVVLDETDMSSIGPTPGPLSLIANLSSTLVTLSLVDTKISGYLTSDIFCLPNLQKLNLGANQDIQVHVPKLNCNTFLLSILDLSECHFHGPIPSSFFNLTYLTSLILVDSFLNGSIPSSLSNLHHLVYLVLSRNNLSGKIPNLPSSLFTLTRLSQLDCSSNQIEGPLSDKVAFSNLTELFLEGNLLNGTIPSSILSLKSLRTLDLSKNQFIGPISGEITSYSLEYLDLCNNKLQGNFPESIFHLVNLSHLCLSSNKWSGTTHFPLFSKLQNLEYLSLSGCSLLLLESETSLLSNNIIGYSKFSGNFPQLKYLELSNNKLEGKVPKWIHDIHSLIHLKLSHNMFTSIGHQFPWYQFEYLDLSFNLMDDDISSFFCNATFLNEHFHSALPIAHPLGIWMNKFHGTLPDTFEDLITLNLNGNQFRGLLPKSLSNCTDLMDLNLGNNQFEDTFPNWLQNLLNLEILVLQGNQLYGPIVKLKSENTFPSLIIFDISSNNFSGSLPRAYIQNFQAMKIQSSLYYYLQSDSGSGEGNIEPEYDNSMTTTVKGVSITLAKIPNAFANIDLSSNNFEGEIPDVFGELQALKGLNLSHNSLIGPIPHVIGNLTNLESLDLSSNMLTGNIPAELTNLIFLEVLNLSSNHLEGSIPRGKQFDTFSNNSYKGNIGLCGLPLTIQCNNNVSLQQYSSSEAEDKFGFGWKPVAIGYAFGMVLGIGLGFCGFSVGKPQWLVIIFGGKRIKRRSHANRHARTTLFWLLVVI
ncbi:hypothetical protein HN873_057996 [Arachis hypogaea]